MRNPVLAQHIDVTLSLSDWLTLAGWMSGQVADGTPTLVLANIQMISRQVNAKARNATPEEEQEARDGV
jgi:hypothetical protein